MLNGPSWTMIRSAVLLVVSAALAPACGGSAEFTAAQAGAAGAGTAGAGSAGGSSSAGAGGACTRACTNIGCGPGFKAVPDGCCFSCVPDGSGGSGGICDAPCIDIGCGPGFKSVTEPGACCPSCVPDGSGGSGGGNTCNGVSCPAIACVNGYHYETAPDQCCGVCVPDGDACSKGQAAYHDLREKLLADLSATACTTNNDCTLLGNNSQCGDQCAADAVNVLAASSVNAELSQFAAANCSTCKTIAPPCAAPPPPLCVAGRCSIYYLD